MGAAGLAWVDTRPGYAGMVVTHDGVTHETARFRRWGKNYFLATS